MVRPAGSGDQPPRGSFLDAAANLDGKHRVSSKGEPSKVNFAKSVGLNPEAKPAALKEHKFVRLVAKAANLLPNFLARLVIKVLIACGAEQLSTEWLREEVHEALFQDAQGAKDPGLLSALKSVRNARTTFGVVNEKLDKMEGDILRRLKTRRNEKEESLKKVANEIGERFESIQIGAPIVVVGASTFEAANKLKELSNEKVDAKESELKGRFSKIESDLKSLDKAISKSNSEITSLKTKIEKIDRKMEALEPQVQSLNPDLKREAELEETVNFWEGQVEILKGDKQIHAKSELEGASQKLADLQIKTRPIMNSYEDLLDEKSRLNKQLGLAKGRLDQHAAAKRSLKEMDVPRELNRELEQWKKTASEVGEFRVDSFWSSEMRTTEYIGALIDQRAASHPDGIDAFLQNLRIDDLVEEVTEFIVNEGGVPKPPEELRLKVEAHVQSRLS